MLSGNFILHAYKNYSMYATITLAGTCCKMTSWRKTQNYTGLYIPEIKMLKFRVANPEIKNDKISILSCFNSQESMLPPTGN